MEISGERLVRNELGDCLLGSGPGEDAILHTPVPGAARPPAGQVLAVEERHEAVRCHSDRWRRWHAGKLGHPGPENLAIGRGYQDVFPASARFRRGAQGHLPLSVSVVRVIKYLHIVHIATHLASARFDTHL